jgi:branched-subunit amino acid transport protein
VSTWSALVIVLVVGAMTYVMRTVVIVALADRPIPVPVERALRNVGPAVLTALAVNLAAGGEGGPSLELAEGAAMLAAGAVGWWRRKLLDALGAGMTVLWVLIAVAG